jgi:preprotein translocase subunit YajC
MQQYLPLLLLAGVAYVALIMPQQKRTKEHKALLAGLHEGDEIIMTSGIHGFVAAIEGDILWVEVAEKVELKISRSAVASKIKAADDAASDSDKADG